MFLIVLNWYDDDDDDDDGVTVGPFGHIEICFILLLGWTGFALLLFNCLAWKMITQCVTDKLQELLELLFATKNIGSFQNSDGQ